jgi:hypothetical protein
MTGGVNNLDHSATDTPSNKTSNKIKWNLTLDLIFDILLFLPLPSDHPSGRLHLACPAFTGPTTGEISTKLYRSDQFHM